MAVMDEGVQAAAGPPERLRRGTRTRLVVLAIVALIVAAVAFFPRLRDLERSGLIELTELGRLAPVALVAGYAVAACLLLPAFPFDLAAGAHFGFWEGVLWVQVAATFASVCTFQLSRHVFRRPVELLLERRPDLHHIDVAVAEEGWRFVFLTRLSPVFSFSALSWIYGATRIPFGPYVLATFFGVLPGTALYVYAGLVAGDLSGAPGHPAPRTQMQWTLEILGLIATAVVVVLVTRRAQRVLSGKLQTTGACRVPHSPPRGGVRESHGRPHYPEGHALNENVTEGRPGD